MLTLLQSLLARIVVPFFVAATTLLIHLFFVATLLLATRALLFIVALQTTWAKISPQIQLIPELGAEFHDIIGKGEVSQVHMGIEQASLSNSMLIPLPEVRNYLSLMFIRIPIVFDHLLQTSLQG